MALAVRALLLLLLALVPAAIVQAVLEGEARVAREARVHEEVLRLARMVANQQERTFEGARQLLAAMAAHAALRAAVPGEECDQFLAQLVAQYPRYHTTNLFGLDGRAICSASPMPAGVSIADRRYFQAVLRGAPFAVGQYTVGRGTGQRSLHLAAPLLAGDGELRGVLVVALSVDWLGADLESLALPPATAAAIIDDEGTLLARRPEGPRFVGSRLPPDLQWLLLAREATTMEAAGVDGVRRIAGVMPVADAPQGLLVTVALPGDAIVEQQLRDERRATLMIVAALLFSLILGIVAFQRAVDQPVRRLLTAAEAWSREDWSARVGPLGGRQSEFGRIAASLDAMASAVSQAEQARLVANARVVALSEVSPLLVFTAGPAGRLDWVNPFGRRMVGLGLHEGGRTGWLRVVQRDDRRRAIAAWRRALAEARAGGAGAFEVELRVCRAADKTWRWLLCRAVPLRDAAGRIIAWAGAGLDVHDLRTARALAAERLEQLEATYRHAPVGLCLFDRELRFRAINALLAESNGHPPEAHLGRTLRDMAPAVASLIEPRLRQVLATGRTERFEVDAPVLPGRAARSIWLCTYDAVFDTQGRTSGISGSALEVTDLKQAEEHARLLACEVDHRARNVLAVLRSLIRLSAAEAPGSVAEMVHALEGRVDAMGRVHTLLANERWASADLAEIVRAETAAHASQVELDGRPVRLVAEAAQPLTLVLHEMMTNATKYGALSCPEGRLAVSWRAEGEGVVVEWREHGGPSLEGMPSRRGFGTELIDANAGAPLDGGIERVWAPEGLRCRIRIGPAALRRD